MLSNHTRSNLQVFLKLDSQKVFESQASMQSLELLLGEIFFAMSEALIPLNLEKLSNNSQNPLEVKSALFLLGP